MGGLDYPGPNWWLWSSGITEVAKGLRGAVALRSLGVGSRHWLSLGVSKWCCGEARGERRRLLGMEAGDGIGGGAGRRPGIGDRDHRPAWTLANQWWI